MKSKRMKSVKAWAIVDHTGRLIEAHSVKKAARERAFVSERIIRVLITEVPRKVKHGR